MTLEEYQTRISGLAAAEARLFTERAFIVGATRLVASINQRIIRRGQASDGSKIGTYSTKPIYANKDQFVRKSSMKPKGMAGLKKFKNGRNHKSMYLANGYKELREVQGREGSFVNLEYTGSLMNDLKVGRSGTSVVVGFTNEAESKKRRALEAKYGKRIFSGSKEDFDKYKEALNREASAIVNQLLH